MFFPQHSLFLFSLTHFYDSKANVLIESASLFQTQDHLPWCHVHSLPHHRFCLYTLHTMVFREVAQYAISHIDDVDTTDAVDDFQPILLSDLLHIALCECHQNADKWAGGLWRTMMPACLMLTEDFHKMSGHLVEIGWRLCKNAIEDKQSQQKENG